MFVYKDFDAIFRYLIGVLIYKDFNFLELLVRDLSVVF